MPDVTMCVNSTCPFRDQCYRYRAIPDPYWQSYAKFEPKDEPFGGYGDKALVCEYCWGIDKGLLPRCRPTAVVDKELSGSEIGAIDETKTNS